MTKILCATRGGAESYRAQDAASRLAREIGNELFFLYVVDIEFLHHTERAIRPDIVEAEMEKLGAFLLEMARERAADQGVEAKVVLRNGVLGEELAAAASELQADTIVLGQPAEGSVYSLEELEAFAARLGERTGCTVLIL
jgi:nucleotide-binding universal stress UspA family protein